MLDLSVSLADFRWWYSRESPFPAPELTGRGEAAFTPHSWHGRSGSWDRRVRDSRFGSAAEHRDGQQDGNTLVPGTLGKLGNNFLESRMNEIVHYQQGRISSQHLLSGTGSCTSLKPVYFTCCSCYLSPWQGNRAEIYASRKALGGGDRSAQPAFATSRFLPPHSKQTSAPTETSWVEPTRRGGAVQTLVHR
ncbi:uncharacterized protein ACIBXB_010478 [Morphnus guianensis]